MCFEELRLIEELRLKEKIDVKSNSKPIPLPQMSSPIHDLRDFDLDEEEGELVPSINFGEKKLNSSSY